MVEIAKALNVSAERLVPNGAALELAPNNAAANGGALCPDHAIALAEGAMLRRASTRSSWARFASCSAYVSTNP